MLTFAPSHAIMVISKNVAKGKKMKNERIYKLVLAAVFCALVFTLTWVSIPAPTVGNINLGDCMVLLSGVLLGNAYAAVAAGLGAALCDLAGGYAIYVPATFVIKALMVVVVCLGRKYAPRGKHLSLILSALVAEIVMILGYLIYEAFALGYGVGAVASIPFNAIQGGANIVVFVLLFTLLSRAGIVKMLIENERK